jgi:hypothetical protein
MNQQDWSVVTLKRLKQMGMAQNACECMEHVLLTANKTKIKEGIFAHIGLVILKSFYLAVLLTREPVMTDLLLTSSLNARWTQRSIQSVERLVERNTTD